MGASYCDAGAIASTLMSLARGANHTCSVQSSLVLFAHAKTTKEKLHLICLWLPRFASSCLPSFAHAPLSLLPWHRTYRSVRLRVVPLGKALEKCNMSAIVWESINDPVMQEVALQATSSGAACCLAVLLRAGCCFCEIMTVHRQAFQSLRRLKTTVATLQRGVSVNPFHSSTVTFSQVESNPIQSSLVRSSRVQSSPVRSSRVQSSSIGSSPVQSSPVQSRPVPSCPIIG